MRQQGKPGGTGSRHSGWWRACLPVMAAAGLSVALALPGVAGKRAAYSRGFVDLRLARPEEADKLVAVLPDPAATRSPRKAVTDLVLVASTQGVETAEPGTVEAALAAANAEPPQQRLFGLRLLAVVGGRLQHHGTAVCGGWQSDRSRCRLACDGGQFDLARRLTADGPSFRLVVSGREDGLLVSPCDDSGTETRLVPKAGTEAEIVLRAD